ncbi:MAG TPA: rhomboid family intramembrane serine protease [Chthoniobacteraceae bacterium]|nr:rhomboid family intramembrane serine protease [Chthoniobacteraceae bacterium]
MNTDFPEMPGGDGRPLAVVGVYPTRPEAYDRSLVVSAMEVPHWILKREGDFALCVRLPDAIPVAEELARFEAEREDVPPLARMRQAKFSTLSLYVCFWIMSGFYLMQSVGPKGWEDRGAASSQAIMRGQWWLAFTALTLHANLGHIGANLAAGLLYAAFLLPLMGAGWTWLFMALAGGLGNWLNAWGYRHVQHLSIGASTSVFAALGILVAAQCTLQARSMRAMRLRDFLLPVGAGLGLLAYLGVGDQQTDSMAHLWGLIAGAPFGVAAVWLRLGERTPRAAQYALAWSAPLLLAACWWLAMHR